MSKTGSSVTEFDWKTELILKELRTMGDTGTTSELRERTGIENGDKIVYRFREKLEPAGYLETEQPPAEPGNIPAKKATLTSRGEGLADQLLDADDSDDPSISAEVDQLQTEVNRLGSIVEDQQETIDEQEEAIEELQGRYNQMYEAYQELSGTSD